LIVFTKNFKGIDSIINLFNKDDLIFVEIGVYAGDASLRFLKSNKIKKYYAIDPWMNNYDSNDSLSKRENMGEAELSFDKKTKKYFNRIVKLKLKSDNAVKFIEEKIDGIYIDGLHSYEGVKHDIQNYYPLIKDGGIISGHDYNNTWSGVIRAVNEVLGKPDYVFDDSNWVVIKKRQIN